jgi:hypothetical protein
MNKQTFALGVIIAITVMLAIPNAPIHIVKASSCSSSSSETRIHVQQGQSLTGPGSCATSGVGSSANGDTSGFAISGKSSSCSAISGAITFGFGQHNTTSGSVSCSSDSP